ncbi:Na+/H+ antiporter NhaA [Demequina sp.]|uniref:Na+/H+ antiporter NhaA n=1 Tax=Demequina sp. TaxID=2050685 RepID=UPI003D0B5AB5
MARVLFGKPSDSTERTLVSVLRTERAGGVMLLLGAVVALLWANSRWASSYESVSAFEFGPASLHLHLSVETWAADGLLAIFFFVIGLELKRELVVGELRSPATAVVPAVAAVGGMVAPIAIYVGINLARGGSLDGWAVPTATDIAFAVAVLAIVGRGLPSALRAFLLTLAVVDDLLAILIIAIFFTDEVSLPWLAASAACIFVFGLLARRGFTKWWALLPLALVAWATMHASGVHATIAGVALGLVVPAVALKGHKEPLTEKWEHLWRPVSSGFAVPVFALFAAGIPITVAALNEALHDPVAQGVALGLVIGKPLGIVLATFLVATFTKAALDPGLSWWDIMSVGALAGIGFTVSLLIAELALDEHMTDVATMAILIASVVAAVIGAALLAWRARVYRRGAATNV